MIYTKATIDSATILPGYSESVIPAWSCEECAEISHRHLIINGTYDFLLYQNSMDFGQVQKDLSPQEYEDLLAEYQRMEKRFHNRHWEIIPIFP